MRGPAVSLAGGRRTDYSKILIRPASPEAAAIWPQGTQLILLTFPLVNKCLEIAWPKGWTRGKPIHSKKPLKPTSQIKGWGTMGTEGWP